MKFGYEGSFVDRNRLEAFSSEIDTHSKVIFIKNKKIDLF